MTAPFATPSGAVFVLREPGTQNDEWHVSFNGRVCSPTWRQRGPAQAYLNALVRGTRKPEYAGPTTCDRGPACRFGKCQACGDPDYCRTHGVCGTCGSRR